MEKEKARSVFERECVRFQNFPRQAKNRELNLHDKTGSAKKETKRELVVQNFTVMQRIKRGRNA
jgi:hypothetical protein